MVVQSSLLIALTFMAQAVNSLPPPMEPSGKWIAEGVPSGCRATRTFGQSGEVALRISAKPLTSGYFVSVAQQRRLKVKAGDIVSIELQPSGKIFEGQASIDRGQPTIIGIDVDRPVLASGIATTIKLSTKTDQIAYLALGSLPSLLAVLKSCENGMLIRLGVDMAAQAFVATLPEALPDKTSYSDDYPAEAARVRAQGIATGRFIVSADGVVRDCVVVSSSGNPALDQRSCVVVARSRFKPGLDKVGRPVASAQVFAVNWILPVW
jgi:TonB family protein